MDDTMSVFPGDLVRLITAFLRKEASGVSVAASTLVESLLEPIIQRNNSPETLFSVSLVVLVLIICFINILQAFGQWHTRGGKGQDSEDTKPASVRSLQLRFLPVFWLLRMAFWISGPYFYAVYASKIVNGAPATVSFISQISLVGFGSIALFGPAAGRALDQYGRKKGTIAASVMHTLGALSTQSSSVSVLFVGRALGAIGTSLMSNAPEAWLDSEALKSGDDPSGRWLRETFGLAYSLDSVVGMVAGQLAAWAAGFDGPTGPFKLTPFIHVIAGAITIIFWKENEASCTCTESSGNDDNVGKPTIRDALGTILTDRKIMMVGAIQSLFEGSMYIFVLQWPPVMHAAVQEFFGPEASTPYGTVFSCFMACCMLGSTAFREFAKQSVSTECSTTLMLAVATIAMAGATLTVTSTTGRNLAAVMATFFVFEACVGMYFPSIGTLRGKYLPDCHRTAIMTIIGVPLNVLVVSVFLFIERLGVKGAVCVSSIALAVATLCMIRLDSIRKQEAAAKVRWKSLKLHAKRQIVVNKWMQTAHQASKRSLARRGIRSEVSYRMDIPSF